VPESGFGTKRTCRHDRYLSAFGGTADNDGGRILGTGQMGKVMAANLLKAGHRVRAWDKSSKPLHAIVAAN